MFVQYAPGVVTLGLLFGTPVMAGSAVFDAMREEL